MVYGNSRTEPGDEKSPAAKLKKIWNSTGRPKDWIEARENLSETEIEENLLLGIWAPPNSLGKATVLKLLFPNLSNPFKMPELKEVPLHVAVAFDAYKAKEVFELSEKYPGKVMSIGYFSSDFPGEAKLLGKTTEQFEARKATVTYEEKLIIQLAKDDAQCFMEFMDLGPSYMSMDVEVGELDCSYFFPSGYNTPEAEIITYLKKKKRKGKINKLKVASDHLDTESVIADTDVDTSILDITEEPGEENLDEMALGDEANNEESDEEADEAAAMEKQKEIGSENVDKTTSPIA